MHSFIHIALLACITQCSIAAQQPVPVQKIPVRQADQINLLNHTPPQVYQDQLVLRVETSSEAQLQSMLSLVESVWSEATGIGPLDIQIKQSNLQALADLDIPFEILIQDLQSYTNTNWSQIVDIERATPKPNQLDAPIHDDNWFANYKQLNEIASYIDNIVALRPDLASTSIIGQSWEGRDMFAVTISAPDSLENPLADRPAVFLFSTVHAREWIAPMTTTYFASKLTEDYDTDPRVKSILDSTRIVIVPVANPDGYLYTWSDQRYWRKNRRENYGVDINRNWGYEWGGRGSSGSTGSETYRGEAPFSEPETAALRDAGLSYGDKLIAHIDYHSYSQLILYPFGFNSSIRAPEPDRSYFRTMCRELSSDIRSIHDEYYSSGPITSLYEAAGNSVDWFYGELGANSITFELRTNNSFNPDPDQILPNAQENYYAFQRYAERVVEPIGFWFTPPERAISNTPTFVKIEIHDGLAPEQPTPPLLMVRIAPDQDYEPITMSPRNQIGQYEAELPASTCDTLIEYYFQTTRADGSIHSYPPDASQSPLTLQPVELVVAHADDFELDSGWIVGTPDDTATEGIWNRMDPEETSFMGVEIYQPEDDHTPYGTACWVTDGFAGDDLNANDVDGGYTTLTSPVFEALNIDIDPQVSFWYWWITSSGSSGLNLYISNDNGQTWQQSGILPTTPNRQWTQYTFRISDRIQPTNEMRFRFLVWDNTTIGTVEAAIDDLKIEFLGCPSTNPADLNNNGILEYADVQIFLNAYTAGNPASDLNNDASLNFLDISAFLTAFTQGIP